MDHKDLPDSLIAKQKESIRRAQAYRREHGDPLDDLAHTLDDMVEDEALWQQVLDDPDIYGDPEDYKYLLRDKAKRTRRRELEALREPGHLRVWFAKQDGLASWDYETVSAAAFRQLMRSHRHSCHAACCAITRYVKRQDRRQKRHEAKQALHTIREGDG